MSDPIRDFTADPVGSAPARTGPPGGRGVYAAAGLIAAVTLLARIVGFGRWLVFSGTVGATCVGTVYSTANQLPNVLYEVAAGGALAAVAVPLIAGQLARGETDRADRTASALLTRAVVVLVPLAVALVLVARPLSELMLHGAEGHCPGSTDLAVSMITVFAIQVPLYGIGIVLSGVLQAHRRFLAAALAPLLSSVVVIVAYLGYGVLARGQGNDLAALPGSAAAMLSVGTTLGVVALSVPLVVPVRRAGARLRPAWRFPDGQGRRVASLAGAGLLGLLAQQAAVLVTVWVATNRGGTGTLNVYQYIQAVYLLPYAVLAVPVAMSAFPALAAGGRADGGQAAVAAGEPLTGELRTGDDAAGTLRSATRVVTVGMGAGAAVLAAAAGPVASFFGVLDRGRHSGAGAGALDGMAAGLVAFAPGLLGFGLAAVLTRALYVRGRPTVVGAWVAAGWALAALGPLVVLSGDPGPRSALLALGAFSAAGMSLTAAGLLFAVHRAWGAGVLAGLPRSLGASVGAAVLGAVAGSLVAAAVPGHGLLGSVGSGVLAAAVAAGMFLLVLRVADPSGAGALLARLHRRRPA